MSRPFTLIAARRLEGTRDLADQLLTGFASRYHGLLPAALNASKSVDSSSIDAKLTLRERASAFPFAVGSACFVSSSYSFAWMLCRAHIAADASLLSKQSQALAEKLHLTSRDGELRKRDWSSPLS